MDKGLVLEGGRLTKSRAGVTLLGSKWTTTLITPRNRGRQAGDAMARECFFTGKKTTFGRSYARRGKAKYLGGVGRKTTGITKRKFKPNVQKVRAVIDGRVVRVKASAKAIRMGLIVKPVKRTWKPEESAA